MVLSGTVHGPAPLARAAAALAAALAAAAVLAATADVARAVAPPPPAMLPVLAERCREADYVRIETTRSSRFRRDVRLEADAVVVPGVKRAALIEVGTPPEKRETRIPWAEVERIDLGRDRTAQGFLVGGLVGATLGGLIVGVNGTDLAEGGDNAVLAFAILVGVGCTALGTILGAGSPAWTPLYP